MWPSHAEKVPSPDAASSHTKKWRNCIVKQQSLKVLNSLTVYKTRDYFRKHQSLKIFLKQKKKKKEKLIANMVIPRSHPVQAGVTISPKHKWNIYLARILFSISLCRREKASVKLSPLFLFYPLVSKWDSNFIALFSPQWVLSWDCGSVHKNKPNIQEPEHTRDKLQSIIITYHN